MQDDDLAEVQKLTPLISKISKEIREEEQRLDLLLTADESQDRFEAIVDVLIGIVRKYAPDAAPTIYREIASAILRAG